MHQETREDFLLSDIIKSCFKYCHPEALGKLERSFQLIHAQGCPDKDEIYFNRCVITENERTWKPNLHIVMLYKKHAGKKSICPNRQGVLLL